MSSFVEDTRIEPIPDSPRHFRARLSKDWAVWGPNGGYISAIALRAIGAATALPRPVSFCVQYLSMAKFEDVELTVNCLKSGRTLEAYQVAMTQEGKLILAASAWVSAPGMKGYEYQDAVMPDVPRVEDLRGYAEVAEDYDRFYGFFQSIEGRPCNYEGTVPGQERAIYRGWFRCKDPIVVADAFVEAGRSLLWLDSMMWTAALMKLTRPYPYVAPNLDLAVQFHHFDPEAEWLLNDAQADVAGEGLISGTGRVWSPRGRMLASGSSHLVCRPNPDFPRS